MGSKSFCVCYFESSQDTQACIQLFCVHRWVLTYVSRNVKGCTEIQTYFHETCHTKGVCTHPLHHVIHVFLRAILFRWNGFQHSIIQCSSACTHIYIQNLLLKLLYFSYKRNTLTPKINWEKWNLKEHYTCYMEGFSVSVSCQTLRWLWSCEFTIIFESLKFPWDPYPTPLAILRILLLMQQRGFREKPGESWNDSVSYSRSVAPTSIS